MQARLQHSHANLPRARSLFGILSSVLLKQQPTYLPRRTPEWLQSALHALYPAYFVYGSVRRLTGPEGPRAHASSKRAVLLLAAACVLLGVRGARAGERARRLTRRTV
mmetsp:Transcript_39194/g.82205  ORF Transcript_39194/g.82205 Transcript_39194/m.82205 type:complete len:108 (+) Transcript_39194:63-386(+)